jgi:hypothetical protein
MLSNLPKYKITIDSEYSDGEDLGINEIAFTSTPAIKMKGLAFSAQTPKKQVFADKVKMRLAAPAIIPMEIYRNDVEEYYVEFTEKEIEKIHQKFMKKLGTSKGSIFNLEHDTEQKVPAYIFETWLVENPEQDKSFSTYGIKVPKGTMFVVAQLTDQEYFNKLVENEQTGFSIEGFLGLKLSEIINNNKQKEEKMNELTLPDGEHTIGEKIYVVKDGAVIEVRDVVKEVELAETELLDGTKVRVEGDLAVGNKAEVYINGEWVKAPEGQHNLADGRVIYVDAEGLINEIETPDTKKVDEVGLSEEVKEEEEVIEEEMQEDVITEEVVTEETSTYSKADLDAKFDELYRMIAELKIEESDIEDEIEVEEAQIQLTAHQKFSVVTEFLKRK